MEASPQFGKTVVALSAFALSSRAVNMRSVQTAGSFARLALARFSALLSRWRHSQRVSIRRSVLRASTSLRPLAPRALPRFDATMSALTPARAALRLQTDSMNSAP
jgi:hypothetical protein